jgi:hypothetical protein
MEQIKASDDEWRQIERASKDSYADVARAVCELRDRVAALEAPPDRVLVRNQIGEYVRAGTPVYMTTPPELDADAVLSLAAIIRSVDGAHNLGAAALAEAILLHPDATGVLQLPAPTPPAAVPSDEELWNLQLAARMQAEPDVGWRTWRSDLREAPIAAHRALHDYGYERGLAAGRAEQGGTPEPEPMAEQQAAPKPEPTHPQYFSSHHAIAGEIWGMLPDAPEPNQAPAGDGGLVEEIRRFLGQPCGRLLDSMARAVIRAVAKWLRSMGHFCAATDLEREAQR